MVIVPLNEMKKEEEEGWLYCAIKWGNGMNSTSCKDLNVLIPTACQYVFIHSYRGLHIRSGITKWHIILGYVGNPK